MKWNRWLSATMVSMILGFGAVGHSGCSSGQPGGKSEKAAQYTCPMHPEVVKDNPGDCPKCGMQLVQKK
jgi:hypothetical protein